MRISVEQSGRKYYLKFEMGTGSTHVHGIVSISSRQLEQAQAYAASYDVEHLSPKLLAKVTDALNDMRKIHAESIRREDMRHIDVVAVKPRLVSTAPTPINQRFYWRRMSTLGKLAYGSPVSVNSSSAAERKRKQDEERKKSNSQVKRDYRLTPKN